MVLFLATLLVFAGAAVVAARLYPRSGAAEQLAERGVATTLIATAIIEGVIYALGWSGRLSPAPMALGAIAIALFAAALAWATTPASARPGLRADTFALVTGPFALVRSLARVRSVAALGLVWVFGLAVWTAYVAWLAPSGAWDGLWYHEPMVGFALQNRGFAIVPLPPGLEMINGYPRAVENLMLWASALYDRRLVDVVPSFAILVSLLGVFTLARRHGASQPASAGLAVVAVTIPGAVLELRSTYVDLSVLAATLLALHFVSRPELRARDAWMAGLALGILGAIKANGAVFAAILGAWLLLRAIVRLEGKLVLHVLGGFVFAAAMALPTYARNQILHDNPIWPITYESQLFGVRFEGTIDAGHMQRDFAYVWNELVGPPQIGENYHDTGRHAYGYALPFVAAPLLIFAAPALLRAWLGSLREAQRRPGLTALLFCLGFGLIVQLASPGHHWARFSLAFPATALVVIGWWLAARPRARLEEGALGAMLVLNAATLWWAVPAWDVTVREALDLAGMSLAERNLASTSLCLLPADTRRRRDLELGPGDVGAFTDDIGFVGNLWNDDFSNRVIFVPFESREAFLERLDAEHVEWVYVRNDSIEARALAGATETWTRVGPASFDDEIYARIPEAAAPPP
ncbi:MAG: hypothetical protein OHK0013_45530 [Sandaracinaceae bacterium]